MNIQFVKDKLIDGYVYPCTIKEIKTVLSKLPSEHIEGIKRIRLSYQKTVNSDASYINGIITIYAVPHDFKLVYESRPPDTVLKEHAVFGARWQNIGNCWFCYWKHELYKKYILEHVLLHEIGHHVDEYHKLRRKNSKEEFAEQYALIMRKVLK